MRFAIALAAVLCLARTCLATETYDAVTKTLTVTADSLASTIDPLTQVQDFGTASYAVPAMTKDAFNALSGLKTITFNSAPDLRQGTTRIIAYYDANHYVTFSGFGSASGYNYGGGTSSGRRAHSGSQDWQQLGLVNGDAASGPFHPDASTAGLEALNWLKMSIAVSEPGQGVSAIGFILDGRDDQNTQGGSIWVTLNDTTEVKLDYTTFGGAASSGLFFGYQAPAGKFITGIEGTRLNKSGNSFLALDDLTFVLYDSSQPIPPAAIADLAVSGTTGTSATLTWTAPGDSGNTGTAASYDIRYSTSTITPASFASASQVGNPPAPIAAGSTQSATVTGLSTNTTYYFAIKTTNHAGAVSALSNVASGEPQVRPPQADKRILGQADFRYKGYYRVPTGGNFAEIQWGQGFTHRYVNGQLRFLTFSFYGNVAGGGCQLIEMAAPTSLGGATTFVNHWPDILAGTGLGNGGAWMGLWYEQARGRLWTTWAIDYPDDVQDDYTKSLAIRTLNDDGTISNAAGAWGLTGVQQRRIYGGVVAIPQWFQDYYHVGPYAAGWGGYASRMSMGVSLGPTFYAIPDPTAYPAGDIPTSAFKTLMDHGAATLGPDWYASGHPTSFDRGVRNSDLRNDYDIPYWQAPAPDGLGRWTYGDSAWNTGAWIETPTRQGFIIVPKFSSGRAWYETSTLHCERQTAEIQVFDPKMLGEVARGTRASWNTYPSSRWEITNDCKPFGLMFGMDGDSPRGGPAAASYDAATQQLYVYCLWGTNVNSYILVYDVGPIPGDIDGDSHVNAADLLYLASAWGSVPGDANYNGDCDLTGDGSVNVVDLLTLADNWGM